jgi:cytochrome b subunit of formate dehydrogenase
MLSLRRLIHIFPSVSIVILALSGLSLMLGFNSGLFLSFSLTEFSDACLLVVFLLL